jgi:hypothetical protein
VSGEVDVRTEGEWLDFTAALLAEPLTAFPLDAWR